VREYELQRTEERSDRHVAALAKLVDQGSITPQEPLRYPGGKSKLGPFLGALFAKNKLVDGWYAEPDAGGAGAGLYLLFRGYASRFLLNDIDRAIVSFWRAVLHHNEKFARRIETVPLSVTEWDRQKCAYATESMGFELGFALFYLNRTNRSGIMNAGVIGGRKQTGSWGIDARFNRMELAARVRALGQYRLAIFVTRLDALEFLTSIESAARRERILVCLDPPYFGKGRDLYTNYYTAEDHAAIAARVRTLRLPWVLAYDDCAEIRRPYRRSRVYESEVTYSARDASRGRELLMIGQKLHLPTILPAARHSGRNPGFELLVPTH
jgi:DNA adenine methylase